MAQEIERKYLVLVDKLPQLENGETFIQGILSIEPYIRFRIKGNEVTIAIKKFNPEHNSRREYEFTKVLSKKECSELKAMAVVTPVIKTRYKIPFGNLVWEIDVYEEENKGLLTADVELPEVDYLIEFPEWIDQTKEITNNPKYFNRNLGNKPYSKWADKTTP